MIRRIWKHSPLVSLLWLSFATASFAQVPQVNHVFIVVEENESFSQIIGNPTMPYLNSLANRFGLATNYFANTHPSIGNYLMLTTGQILTNDDSQTPSSFPVTVDNIIREILAAGKTWKDYAESLPSVGYLGGNSGQYAVRHNPIPYFSDVQNSPQQQQNVVPFEDPNVGFAHDLANNTLPNYSFIAPNLCNDAHDCPVSTADTWLRNNIDPLVTSPLFQTDGILVIVFDEGSDNANGGGQVVWVVVSPKAKTAFQSTNLYQHQSTLRMMAEAIGLKSFPGAAATAQDMAEFFGVSPGPPPTRSDFNLSGAPASQTVTQGGSTSYTLSISPTGGFAGSVGLSASGLPNGANATFSPTAPTTSSTMTVSTSASTPTGSFNVTITGTNTSASGTLTHSASVTLVVNAAVIPDFSLSPSPNSRSVTQGASTTYTVNINSSGGFTGSVKLSASGLPSGGTATFNPNSATGSSTMTVTTVATTPTGSYPVTITGTSGTLTRTASATFVVTAVPKAPAPVPPPPPKPPAPAPPAPQPQPPTPGNFSLTATPPSQGMNAGAHVKFAVTVTGSSGYTGTIQFHIQGLPRGATAHFSPPSLQNAGSSTLALNLWTGTRRGKYRLTITGTSQHLTRRTSVVLVVGWPPPVTHANIATRDND